MTPSLATLVRRALDGECALPPGSTVLVATSGGPDSMALLSVLARAAPKRGLSVRAHGVDHGLRPEAAAELDLASDFAAKQGIPFDRTVVAVERGGNLQARARAARYEALISVARVHQAVLATAHHAADRAETVLMRLLRGSGARGLAALPPRDFAAGALDVAVIRPILRAMRTDVVAHLERHRVPSATDPSNDDPRYLRTRIRAILPLLEELDPAIVSHLAALSDELGGLTTTRRNTEASWMAGLPRTTQLALNDLVRSRSTKARVWLPGGLVAMVESNEKHQKRGKRSA